MTTFSIIIPVYNVAPYLRECLDSVLAAARTLNEKCKVKNEKCGVEIICVDDGSTDGSGAILDEYAEKVEKSGGGGQRRITVLHQSNRGVSAARNAALDVATGEWIVFVDSDDLVTKDFLCDLSRVADECPGYDIIGYNPVTFDDQSASERVFHPTSIDGRISDDVFSQILRNEIYAPFTWTVWDKCYRRSVVEEGHIRFLKGLSLGEDGLFAEMALSRARSFVAVGVISGYRYRQRSGSLFGGRCMTLDDQKNKVRHVAYAIEWGKRYGSCAFNAHYRQIAFRLFLCCPGANAEVNDAYVNHLLDSCEFNKSIIPSMLTWVNVRALFVALYALSPRRFRLSLIRALNVVKNSCIK